MAPIKLEDHMKERLEERSLEPSAAAWERISGKLDVAQGKKKNKRVLWTSIAASFIGGIIVTALLLTNGNTEAPELVNTPEVENASEILKEEPFKVEVIKDEAIVNPGEGKDELEEAIVIQEVVKKEDKEVAVPQEIRKNGSIDKTEVIETGIAVQEPKEKFVPIEKITPVIDQAISEKVNEMVAQVGDQYMVTDEELDKLLLKAQRDIISNQIINQKTNKVDATALLLDVEAEVDPETFRDKIFEGLKDGFLKARDAVANRNN